MVIKEQSLTNFRAITWTCTSRRLRDKPSPQQTILKYNQWRFETHKISSWSSKNNTKNFHHLNITNQCAHLYANKKYHFYHTSNYGHLWCGCALCPINKPKHNIFSSFGLWTISISTIKWQKLNKTKPYECYYKAFISLLDGKVNYIPAH